MQTGYGYPHSMSTSTFRWRVILISNVLIGIGGLVLIVLIALGIANPPRAGSIRWQANTNAGWLTHQQDEITVYHAPASLGEAFTLELTAINNGPDDSAWGFWLPGPEAQIFTLISNEGYYTFNPWYAGWQEFPHIQVSKTNTIYFHVNPDGHGTIRINDEIVHDDLTFLYGVDKWGIATYNNPQLTWEQIAIYHE